MKYNKVVIWGLKYNNHTHRYIHLAYKKAFEHIGFNVFWFDDKDEDLDFNFKNSLFLTLGGHDRNIPKIKDCGYIIHNCKEEEYLGLDYLILQVFTKESEMNGQLQKLDPYVFFNQQNKTLIQPWATDLLPNEIKYIKKIKKIVSKKVYFIGSVWNNELNQGNIDEYNQLEKALFLRDIKLLNPKVPHEKNRKYIDKSYISPAIQGKWQINNGYIPDRIFKNISYGAFGITNSRTVYELFSQNIIYNTNIFEMVDLALEKRNKLDLNFLNYQIDFVKKNHTYINRIENINQVFEIY